MNLGKTLTAATLMLAGALATGAAQARDVYWSVGINAPVAGVGVGTVVSNVPHYGYHAAPPAYVQVPAYPVYQPAPVVYAPVPVVRYRPAPPPRYVVVPQGYGHPYYHGHRHGKKHGHRHGHR